MARVQYKSTPGGVLQRRNGDAWEGVTIEHTGTAPFAAATGATPYGGPLTTNIDGEVPAWLDPGVYTTTNPINGKSVTFEVGGIAGADAIPDLQTRTSSLESGRAKKEAVWLNVRDYGAPGDGTDQTAAIQAAIAVLPVAGGTLYFPRRADGTTGDYRYSSTLNFDGKRGVVLRGDGGGTAGAVPATVLYYTATDSSSAISGRGGNGVTLIDLWASHSNSAFSGRILDFRGNGTDTSEPCLVRCRVGSGASAPYNAIGMDLDQAINGSYYRTNFSGNKYGVRGKTTNNSYSVRHGFFGCRFGGSDIKHVYNAGEAWSFYAPTVQQLSVAAGEVAGFLGYDPGMVQHNLTIDAAWAGDVAAGSTTPQVEFAGEGLTIRGSRIANGGAAPGVEVKPPTTLLNGAINSSVTTITVDDSHAGFGDSGTALLDSEEVTFTGRTATTLTGCTRGANGTVAASHADNATVSLLGDTRGIDIDASNYFHYCTYGVILRRGVRGGGKPIRAQGKIDGGSGALTAIALYEQGVTTIDGQTNGQKGALVPPAAAGGEGSTTLLVANRALFGRLVPERDMRVVSIVFGVSVAATADDAVDVGIFTVVNRNLTRVASLGATTGLLNATGIKVATLPSAIHMHAGRTYYVGISCGTVGGTAATLIGHVMTGGGFFHGFIHTQVGEYESIFKDAAHPLAATVTGLSAANTVARLAVREA